MHSRARVSSKRQHRCILSFLGLPKEFPSGYAVIVQSSELRPRRMQGRSPQACTLRRSGQHVKLGWADQGAEVLLELTKPGG